MNRFFACIFIYLYVACTIFALLQYAGIRPDCSIAERQIIAMRVAYVWPGILLVMPFMNAPVPGEPHICR